MGTSTQAETYKDTRMLEEKSAVSRVKEEVEPEEQEEEIGEYDQGEKEPLR